MFDFFKQVVAFHPIQRILVAQEWNVSEYGGQFGLAFITFLYVDILDCTGTLYSMARFCGAIDEKTQDFEGSAVALPRRRLRHLDRISIRMSPSHCLHRIRCRYLRRWRNRSHSNCNWSMLLHLNLLRSHLRFDPTLGRPDAP